MHVYNIKQWDHTVILFMLRHITSKHPPRVRSLSEYVGLKLAEGIPTLLRNLSKMLVDHPETNQSLPLILLSWIGYSTCNDALDIRYHPSSLLINSTTTGRHTHSSIYIILPSTSAIFFAKRSSTKTTSPCGAICPPCSTSTCAIGARRYFNRHFREGYRLCQRRVV
jgi:hypothetical protein